MTKAVIFDIDGTLLDSVDLHAQAWQEAFRHFGREVPLPDVRRQIGKGSDNLLPAFFTDEELQRLEKPLNEYRGELFKKKYLGRIVPFTGVRELVTRILDDGKLVGLASSAKGDEIEDYKRIARIDDLVQEEASADDARHSKPAPDIFSAALHKMDLRPGDAVAIGDTPYDAEAAGKISLPAIGVLCGGWPEKDLRDAGCIEIYQGPGDLLARYGTSRLATQ